MLETGVLPSVMYCSGAPDKKRYSLIAQLHYGLRE